jgi:hypothetical protein
LGFTFRLFIETVVETEKELSSFPKFAAAHTFLMSDDATAALVSYLRLEADLSEQKARRLTQQADALALEHGLDGDMQILDPSELAPLDEFGIPKYRGTFVFEQ